MHMHTPHILNVGARSTSAEHPDKSWGLTQPPIHWLLEDLSLGVTWPGWGMKLATHPNLVLRLRMRGAVPPLLQMPSWYAQVKLVTWWIESTDKHSYFVITSYFGGYEVRWAEYFQKFGNVCIPRMFHGYQYKGRRQTGHPWIPWRNQF